MPEVREPAPAMASDPCAQGQPGAREVQVPPSRSVNQGAAATRQIPVNLSRSPSMNRLTFAQKLWLPLLVSLAGLVVLSLFGAYQARQVRIDERREGLFNVADAAYNVLAQYDDMVKSGTLPLAAAQAQAAARIKAMRFGKDGYFALMTGDETMVLHPNPAMNGKSVKGLADSHGTPLYDLLLQAAQTPEGSFIDYSFPRLGS